MLSVETPSVVQYVLDLTLRLHVPEMELLVDGQRNAISITTWDDAHQAWAKDQRTSDIWASGMDFHVRRRDGKPTTPNDLENVIDVICNLLKPTGEDAPPELRHNIEFWGVAYRAMFAAVDGLRVEIGRLHAEAV